MSMRELAGSGQLDRVVSETKPLSRHVNCHDLQRCGQREECLRNQASEQACQ